MDQSYIVKGNNSGLREVQPGQNYEYGQPGLMQTWHAPQESALREYLRVLIKRKFVVLGCLLNLLQFAQIAPVIFICRKAQNAFPSRGKSQIGINDGENPIFLDHSKKPQRNHVDTAESQWPQIRRRTDDFRFQIPPSAPAAEPKILVKKQ